MNVKKANYDAYRLLHEGAVALAEVQHHGVRIDTVLLGKQIEKCDEAIKEIRKSLEESKTWKEWVKKFGRKAKLTSTPQQAWVLSNVLGVELTKKTEKGDNFKVDDMILDSIDHPFVHSLRRLKKFEKTRGTFLEGIKREVSSDGYLHVNYWLNLVRSYRSSSSDVNFQNFPVRDPEYAKLIRSLFIPRSSKNVLVERDFAGIEVGMSCCYHRDPVMVKYVTENGDMHSDVCKQVYKLSKNEWNKKTRYCAKNMFVFPEFYGSYWRDCSRNLWEAIGKLKLVVEGTDVGLYEHLRSKGITELGTATNEDELQCGTFQHHIYMVEKDFWGRRFKVYAQWKKDYYESYLKNGYFESLTGFVYRGHHVKNDVVNYPIQGSAFHYMLQSLILVMKAIRKYKMKTLIVGEIHDSMLSDTPEKELQNYLDMSTEICEKKTSSMWKWINVPMRVEAEICEGNWFNKKEWIKKEGIWQPK